MIGLESLQTIVQLAAALNVAYFTIRESSVPNYHAYKFLIAELDHIIREDDLYGPRRRLAENAKHDLEDFFSRIDVPNNALNTVLFLSGYGMFFICLAILIYSAIFSNTTLARVEAFAVSLFIFIPVALSIFMEFMNRIKFSGVLKKAFRARDQF